MINSQFLNILFCTINYNLLFSYSRNLLSLHLKSFLLISLGAEDFGYDVFHNILFNSTLSTLNFENSKEYLKIVFIIKCLHFIPHVRDAFGKHFYLINTYFITSYFHNYHPIIFLNINNCTIYEL